MSILRSSGSPGAPSSGERFPDVSALIPKQRPAAEPSGPRRSTPAQSAHRAPPASEATSRPRRRWSPLLAAGSVVLGTACAGAAIGQVSPDFPADGPELSMAEMSAPTEHAPEPAPPVPHASVRAHPPGAVPVAPPLVRVRYELDGAPYAGMISFTSGQASPVTEVTSVRLPWRKEFDASGGFVPSVSVQSAGTGSISCRIMVNGELVSAVTVEGMNAVATCTAEALVESR